MFACNLFDDDCTRYAWLRIGDAWLACAHAEFRVFIETNHGLVADGMVSWDPTLGAAVAMRQVTADLARMCTVVCPVGTIGRASTVLRWVIQCGTRRALATPAGDAVDFDDNVMFSFP